MSEKINFNQEIYDFIIASLVIAFVFAFNDKQLTFSLNFWILNYLKILLFVVIALLVYTFAPKLISKTYGCSTSFSIWRMKQYGFRDSAHFPQTLNLGFKKIIMKSFPLGIFIPIIIAVLSNGQIYFAGIAFTLITINAAYRIGKKYRGLTDYETAKIGVAGPLALILFAIILKFFSFSFPQLSQLILISSWLAITNMLPIPGLDGSQIYFSSRPLFIFSFIFILAAIFLLLLSNIGTLSTLMLSAILAVIILIVWYYYRVYS